MKQSMGWVLADEDLERPLSAGAFQPAREHLGAAREQGNVDRVGAVGFAEPRASTRGAPVGGEQRRHEVVVAFRLGMDPRHRRVRWELDR